MTHATKKSLEFWVPMADTKGMATTDRKATTMYTIWIIRGSFATMLDLCMALNSRQLLVPTDRPTEITGNITGTVSGTTDDDRCWVSVRDGREARKLLLDFTGHVPIKSLRVHTHDEEGD